MSGGGQDCESYFTSNKRISPYHKCLLLANTESQGAQKRHVQYSASWDGPLSYEWRRLSGRLWRNCGILHFNNSPKFEQNYLFQSVEGVSLVDTWTVPSIIRFTNTPIYNLAKTSHTSLCIAEPYNPISPILVSFTPRRRPHVFTVLPMHFCSAVIKLYLSYR
jgi:hypothetical protein